MTCANKDHIAGYDIDAGNGHLFLLVYMMADKQSVYTENLKIDFFFI